MNILVVDDALFLRVTLKHMLENNGYTVVGEASNGHEAIEQYHLLKPDIVTMDITMPKLNGLEAMKSILEIDPDAKIIMCSAMGRNDFQQEAFDNGAVDFITKPFNESIIVEKIERFKR